MKGKGIIIKMLGADFEIFHFLVKDKDFVWTVKISG